MSPGSRRFAIVAAGGGAIVTLLVMTGRPGGDADIVAPAPARGAQPAPAASSPVAGLNLELLDRTYGELPMPERDLFRFRTRRAPAADIPQRVQTSPAPAPSQAPERTVGPAAPPPIPLRFIGLVDAPTQSGRIAVLSDGRGNVFYGKEGDIIEGRYRLLKVNTESAELSHIDGRGRQIIRLSGQ